MGESINNHRIDKKTRITRLDKKTELIQWPRLISSIYRDLICNIWDFIYSKFCKASLVMIENNTYSFDLAKTNSGLLSWFNPPCLLTQIYHNNIEKGSIG